jgi:2-oxoglutarate/2-oxoacid ferredoxin oxidoreductase subunit beta
MDGRTREGETSGKKANQAVRDGRSPKGELREKRINTPEDELRHDVTDELAAYKLAQLPFPGVFGVFYQNDRPTKNALEKKWIETTREKTGNASDLDLLQKTFDRMK